MKRMEGRLIDQILFVRRIGRIRGPFFFKEAFTSTKVYATFLSGRSMNVMNLGVAMSDIHGAERIREMSPVIRRSRTPHGPRPGQLKAMARQRCPRCRRGFVYRHGGAMNNLCPVCGLEFDREPGYFTGSIFFGYFFAVPAVLIFFLIFCYLFPDLDLVWDSVLSMLALIPIVPAIVRLSRVIWIGVDRALRPD
jgi:uncharacterized protein (DUF983 family)